MEAYRNHGFGKLIQFWKGLTNRKGTPKKMDFFGFDCETLIVHHECTQNEAQNQGYSNPYIGVEHN